MRNPDRWRNSLVTPWTVPLASLLFLVGLTSQACSKTEPPSQPPPAAATTQTETPIALSAVEEITITGRMPPEWVSEEETVGPGDTILWKVENGSHGLRFPVKADCDLALATMTFDPPLDPIVGGGCQSKTKSQPGELIVSAKVNMVLGRDVPYDCVVHRAAMPGVLKPK